MLTPKQNLMEVLSNGKPSWVPVCTHIANTNNLPGFLPETFLTEPLDRLNIVKFIGGDILYETSALRRCFADGYEIKTETNKNINCSTMTTPIGSLNEEMQYTSFPSPDYGKLPEGHVLPGPIINSSHTRHFINKPRDYDIIRDFHTALSFEADHELIADEIRRVGDKGIVVLGGGPSSPLYSLVSKYAGIEQFSYDIFDANSEVEAAMNAMQEAGCRWYETAALTPCDVIRCTEDLDTKLVSPKMFKQYAVPALKEYARICHSHGKLFVIHMCGHIREFLEDVRDAGADAIHCLTPPPMGNTPLSEARSTLEGKTAAMIRIDADILLHGNEKQIDEHVAALFEQIGNWGNTLVIIPCGRAPLWNLQRVINQVNKTR